MDITQPTFKTKKLQHSENTSDYSLYKAALEWNLIDPIVIENENDFRSKQDWRGLVSPFQHQVTNLITFCRRLPVTLLSDDVGLGKTISAGLIASELMARGRVSKILVVCPKLLIPQWAEELKTKFGIESIEAVGQELVHANPPNDVGAVITTYHSARIYLDTLGKAGFEMLILDEAHKLRNLYGVQNTPQVALRFQEALKERLFKYVLMLTATPIQNRLWDIYSLVELLTIARGHENPFGTQGMFARNFIADSRTEARQLRQEKRDEFRSIVYGYMSRTRRSDVPLLFPERHVLLHIVNQTPEEIEIFEAIKEPIQELNRLVQISILQALVSSPHALAAQLETSARNGTIPKDLAVKVRSIVNRMQTSAKLDGLWTLIEKIRKEQGQNWRAVIFTERRETQTTIEAFLGEQGISCGLINGESGLRNQETIGKFKKSPPEIHVIISTRAGSEGVNLQAANVLVNYDLPWNPMIVEQRIGRVQRLASEHANVSIFNLILKNTFEEYIVGRLMEKLQMASHAIGDIEALLEAAGMNDDQETQSFEEKIRELVLASLAGQDVQEATRLAEESISQAKLVLEKEEENINAMLGGMDGTIDLGPRCPKLPAIVRSMPAQDFAIAALSKIGATTNPKPPCFYAVELEGRKETIRFDNKTNDNQNSTLCRPGSPFFDKLVSRITSFSLHSVDDVDSEINEQVEISAKNWTSTFDADYVQAQPKEIRRCFSGIAILNVRITNTHDSYERLLEIECASQGEFGSLNLVQPIGKFLEDPMVLGLPEEFLKTKAMEDVGVSEFCRFYTERLREEIKAAGDSFEKKKKLEDDFSPRVEVSLVGLEGKLYRDLVVSINYKIDNHEYSSSLIVSPYNEILLEKPKMEKCEKTNKVVPTDCLSECAISKKKIIKHLLQKSSVSDRYALPEYMTTCALSGKTVIQDEVEKSDVTDKNVCLGMLKTSALSGKKAEPKFFTTCEFTNVDILESESRKSQISRKTYRIDEETHSVVSGKSGHRQEFIFCSETNNTLLPSEAEKCEVTGRVVMPGILEVCEVTGKRVLPKELETSAVSGKKALKKLFVTSSISNTILLESEALRSNKGKYCSPNEGVVCTWSGDKYHPDDIRRCGFTELPFHFRFIGNNGYFSILYDLLSGTKKKSDVQELWTDITSIHAFKNGQAKMESAEISEDKKHLACCVEIKTWIGLKIRYNALIYSIEDKNVIGKIMTVKRDGSGWAKAK